jgi:hypothetical protein
MNSSYFNLLLPNDWLDEVAKLAAQQNKSQSQILRDAIGTGLNLEMDWTEFNYRNPIARKKRKSKTNPIGTNTMIVQANFPRHMEKVLKAAAQSKNWSVSSLIALLIYVEVKDLPSRPEMSAYNPWMGKNYPLNEGPDKYYMRASVPKAWGPRLQEYADEKNKRLTEVVYDIVMKKFGHIKPATPAEPSDPTPANAEQYETAQQS